MYMYIYIYIYIYIYMSEGRHGYAKPQNTQVFILFTCYVYLSFRTLTLLVHKYITYKPFSFLHSVI